mmetsp:Transcript_52254/g.96722  ORF Transcript_52254/g.96722 Transcript_52254/m.96722 type:complete len:108 (+) Transcript_52254:80-403(+)
MRTADGVKGESARRGVPRTTELIAVTALVAEPAEPRRPEATEAALSLPAIAGEPLAPRTSSCGTPDGEGLSGAGGATREPGGALPADLLEVVFLALARLPENNQSTA